MEKRKVYLAGPISGCNEEQLHAWRNDLKRGFSAEFDFVDPADNLIPRGGSSYAMVQADVEAIQGVDAVLAYMWKESIGTSFGILHGHLNNRYVVLCDPNRIGSKMAAFYVDAVERTLEASLNAIRVFFRSESMITGVMKRDGTVEPFDRTKMAAAIRRVCAEASVGDIVPPRAIVSRALDRLLVNREPGTVQSTEIRDAVWDALAELGGEPGRVHDYEAIRRAWERNSQATPAPKPKLAVARPTIHAAPLQVMIHSVGTHSTIWGNKGRVGGEAKAIFNEILRVEGISELRFGQFNNTHSAPARPHVRLQASKTAGVIEGKCFDKGPKGTLQSFQIRVANPEARDAILSVLREHLAGQGMIREVVFSN